MALNDIKTWDVKYNDEKNSPQITQVKANDYNEAMREFKEVYKDQYTLIHRIKSRTVSNISVLE